MPRIPPVAIRQAHHISPHAAHLLPVCRDLPSALNEARWIREHVRQLASNYSSSSTTAATTGLAAAAAAAKEEAAVDRKIEKLCRRRARGEPLQYILGTQPFGDLEMKCRPGVLIPRPEPESYTTYLATLLLLQQKPPLRRGLGLGRGDETTILSPYTSSSLRILDLCTGTGCIALLLYSLLRRTVPHLSIHGVDISPHAVALAQENVRHNNLPSHHHHLDFTRGDIFSHAWLESLSSSSSSSSCLPPPPPSSPPTTEAKEEILPINNNSNKSPPPVTAAAVKAASWDILICNPPYISHWGFARQTARSVRHFEPKLAQVPMVTYPGAHEPEDAFYARLLDVGARLRPHIMLFEVGDLEQAVRVARMALRHAGLRRRDHSLARDEMEEEEWGGDKEEEEKGERRKHHVSVEIWRDWPDATPGDNEQTPVKLGDPHDDGKEIEVRVRGSGHGRSVFIQCQ